MSRKSFLYYLFSKERRPLFEDSAGHVQEGDIDAYFKPDGQPARLKFSPRGWRDKLIKYARNIKYWGLFRDMTVPMEFVGDGAKILRNRMWLFGRECICYLAILRLDRTQVPYRYQKYYLTEINFAKYEESLSGVQVEALDGGLTKAFKANENTKFEIPIDTDPEHFLVKMDGMEFDYNRVYTILPDQPIPGNNTWQLGMIEFSREGNPSDMFFQDMFPTDTHVYPNDQWIMKNDRLVATDVRVRGNIKIFFDDPEVFQFRAETNNGVDNLFVVYDLASGTAPANETRTYDFDVLIPVPAGHRLHFEIRITTPSNGVKVDVMGGEITLEYVYRFRESRVPCLYLKRLVELLLGKLGVFNLSTAWLSVKKDIAVTCGDALRNLPGAVIKTSLSDFFKAIYGLPRDNAGGGASLAIENDTLIIERLDFVFKNTLTIDLGEVLKPKISEAEDLVVNLIKVGQTPNDYTDVNGRYETNQSQEWSTPDTRILREMDLLSPYRKDPLGIELTRINFEKKTTTDSKSDNDNFLLNIQQENVGQAGSFQVAVAAPHAYNVASLVIYDTIAVGPLFTVNDDKNEFTYIGTLPQSVAVLLEIQPTGGGVANITCEILKNGAAELTQLIPTGPTSILNVVVALAPNDVLAVRVSGMASALNVNASALTFAYIAPAVYELNRPAYTAVTGIPHPESAFNLELSPKKCLLGLGALLRSLDYPMDAELISFRSADKNKDLSTTLDGVTVTENENIQIGALPDRLFLPHYLTFTTQLPINVMALIASNPYGRVRFTVEGRQFEGFLFDGSIKPATQDSQNWKVLSAPENDLSKFKAA